MRNILPEPGWYNTATFRQDEAEILYRGLSEHSFLGLEVEPMSAEDVQDPYYDGMVLLFCLTAKDEDFIHVDDYDSFVNELSEDVIHHCLEHRWTVSETK